MEVQGGGCLRLHTGTTTQISKLNFPPASELCLNKMGFETQKGSGVAEFQVASTSVLTAVGRVGLTISDMANALLPASLMDAPRCQQRLPSIRMNLSWY